MSKILSSRHAEDVGCAVVEPGGAIPDNADQAVVKRLEAEGKITEVRAKRSGKED